MVKISWYKCERAFEEYRSVKTFYLLICGCAVRLPHIFPLDLAMLLLLLLALKQRLEGSLHQTLPKEMSSLGESQEPEHRHYQQISSLHDF